MPKPVVLNSAEWSPSAIKYMPPKVNDRGGKSINIISKQTNRSLHISTPLLMTWGISDYVDDNGVSDGKFSMTLNFPNEDYRNPSTDVFLQKMKDFENQILDDAVSNSELWWGETMSREVAKHTFFPFLKYSKNKDTKKIDMTKPPSMRAKVPYYDGKWAVEIYDTNSEMLFPTEDPKQQNLIPSDFVTKLSSVACVLQCGGIWIGGKGWGLTWKLIQCIVKPRDIVSVYGKCHIELSNEDRITMETQSLVEDGDVVDTEVDEITTTLETTTVASPPPPPSVQVDAEDSDEEGDGEEGDEEEEEEVVEPPPPPPAPVVAAPVKRVVKKTAVVAAPVVEAPPVADDAGAKKKKVVKKATA